MKTLKDIAINLLRKGCCDEEIDNGHYRLYISDIKFERHEKDILYVEAVPSMDKTEYILQVGIDDSMNGGGQMLIDFDDLEIYYQTEVYYQIRSRQSQKLDMLIKIHHAAFSKGLDVPKNICFPWIADYILNEDKTEIGEVGLLYDCNNDNLCLSVCFPNRKEPSFTYDVPLCQQEYEDLKRIYDSME